MDDFPMLFSYTRAQALPDGVLIDAGAMARQAGFTVPVALTSGVWGECVAWDEKDNARGAAEQSEAGRLWDVLYMAGHAARLHRGSKLSRVPFVVVRVPKGGRRAERAELMLHIGPGDTREAVITVMLPNED